jgi:hypothetical protein
MIAKATIATAQTVEAAVARQGAAADGGAKDAEAADLQRVKATVEAAAVLMLSALPKAGKADSRLYQQEAPASASGTEVSHTR